MVWIQNQLVGAFVGDRLSIECHVEAFPKSINYWSSENGNLLTQGIHVLIHYSAIVTSETNTFIIADK
jgi:hypothetical protein